MPPIAIFLSLSGCASSPPPRKPVLLWTVGSTKLAVNAESRLREMLAERDDLQVRGVGSLAALAARAEAPIMDRSTEARRHLEQARQAFSRFNYATATAQFKEALRILRPLAVVPAGRERLAAIHLELAKVLLVHGERGGAIAQIKTCLHLDPAWKPDSGRFPPELRALYRELARAGHRASGRLRIDTEPSGATVLLDGRQKARSPAEWKEVDPGPHYVIVSRDGFRTQVATATVTPGQTTERRFSLALGTTSEQAAATLRQVSRHGGRAEQRWRATATNLTRTNVLLLGEAGRSVRLVAFDTHGAALGSGLTLRHEDLPEQGRAWLDSQLPPPGGPWYGKWWLWTPVAAVVAGAVALGVFFATRTPDVTLVGGDTVR